MCGIIAVVRSESTRPVPDAAEIEALLTSASDMSVTEIGFELGYRDPGSFSRAFRRSAGLSPTDFRRQQLPSNPDHSAQLAGT